MKKYKVTFYLMTIIFLAYLFMGIKYSDMINQKNFEIIGSILATFWGIPTFLTVVCN